MQLFVKGYRLQNPFDKKLIGLIEELKTVKPGDHEKIADILRRPVAGEDNLYDVTVRPRGYRLLKQVTKIPPGTADKVVEYFGDFVHLSMANEDNLLSVDGVGEKSAQSIVKGIKHMRIRSIYC